MESKAVQRRRSKEVSPLTFAEESRWLREIEAQAISIRNTINTSPRDLLAYRDGLQQGMARLLVELSAHGKINRVVK